MNQKPKQNRMTGWVLGNWPTADMLQRRYRPELAATLCRNSVSRFRGADWIGKSEGSTGLAWHRRNVVGGGLHYGASVPKFRIITASFVLSPPHRAPWPAVFPSFDQAW